MARYGLINPYGGNFRAYLAANWQEADIGKPYGVGLDTNGFVVKGAGTTGIVGVLVLTRAGYFNEDEPVDVMHDGEIAEFGPTAGVPGQDFGDAGSAYYADGTTGAIAVAPGGTPTAGSVYVGHTVEGSRLVVHVGARAIEA